MLDSKHSEMTKKFLKTVFVSVVCFLKTWFIFAIRKLFVWIILFQLLKTLLTLLNLVVIVRIILWTIPIVDYIFY